MQARRSVGKSTNTVFGSIPRTASTTFSFFQQQKVRQTTRLATAVTATHKGSSRGRSGPDCKRQQKGLGALPRVASIMILATQMIQELVGRPEDGAGSVNR